MRLIFRVPWNPPVAGLKMKCTPVAAYSRPPMCFQVENIGDRVPGGSFDVSTAVPPRLKTWSDCSGGSGAGRFTVWVQVPTSPLADAVRSKQYLRA